MLNFFAALVLSVLIAGCASGNGPREDAKAAQAADLGDDGLDPIGDAKQVCGWSDTGRWECTGAKKKRANSKFSTKFKSGAPPPPPSENKLPRGDKPVVLDPIEDLEGPAGE